MIAEVLEAAVRKGVRLWAEQGELRFKAPKGALTTQDLRQLSTLKPQIMAYLAASAPAPDAPASLRPRQHHGPLPPTFSQAVHWHVYQLPGRPSVRHLAAALKLQGALDVSVLEHCIEALLQRHEVLRTLIVLRDGQPFQMVGPPGKFVLSQVDLCVEPEATREETIATLVTQFVTQPVVVTEHPLFDVRLFKTNRAEHVLVLATEHLISDAQSVGILVRDLFQLYSKAMRGEEIALPPLPLQFADYAAWQMEQLPTWQARHGAYWRERLRGATRVRFPRAGVPDERPGSGWGHVEIRIGAEWKDQMQKWCRAQRTTLVMAVFTAYVATVMQWCNVADAVFRFQTDGRWDRQLQDLVGYLATVLHLRLQLRESDSVVDLLHRTMAEYASASEHADLSFVDAQIPRPEFAVNPAFNWVPVAPAPGEVTALMDRSLTITELPIRREAFSRFNDDHEPVLLCFDRGDSIDAAFHYPRSSFDAAMMQAFADAFRQQLADMTAPRELWGED